MKSVVAWLESPAGQNWTQGHFSTDATDCHDMIELIDDDNETEMEDHRAVSSARMLKHVTEDEPLWADLAWTPDEPPDRV